MLDGGVGVGVDVADVALENKAREKGKRFDF